MWSNNQISFFKIYRTRRVKLSKVVGVVLLKLTTLILGEDVVFPLVLINLPESSFFMCWEMTWVKFQRWPLSHLNYLILCLVIVVILSVDLARVVFYLYCQCGQGNPSQCDRSYCTSNKRELHIACSRSIITFGLTRDQ